MPRSRPKWLESCAISLTSRTPAAASDRASSTTLDGRRDRKVPRNEGIEQKAHVWSQPSAILTNAVHAGVARRRGVVSSYSHVDFPDTGANDGSSGGPSAGRASPACSTIR